MCGVAALKARYWMVKLMSNTIEVRGLERLVRKYERMGKNIDKGMKSIAHTGALYAHSKIPPYPPSRGTRYRRTGTLGRSIKANARRRGMNSYEGVIGTKVEYAPWVISETKGNNQAGPQAWFHKDRWWTLQKVVRDNQKGIVGAMKQQLLALIRKAD